MAVTSRGRARARAELPVPKKWKDRMSYGLVEALAFEIGLGGQHHSFRISISYPPAARIMRILARQLSTYMFRSNPGNSHVRKFSSYNGRDELSIEEEVEKKVGWLLKLIFVGTASYVAYQFFPYMGDNLLQQSISLLQVRDPLFKRMGASRLSRFAIDDERRMRVVEMGGVQKLLNMLGAAKDDRTRKEALKALVALSHSDEAVAALHQAGAISVVKSTPDSLENAEVTSYKSSLLKKFEDLKYDIES
ncbi:hypothetical protein HHK36_018639 [Tetracentron sinense]|uniref:ARM repeat superfamily protein n=1 Tax=Tetracentron sinense TaxID=13715 RepID=A0A834Z1T8_TETSI|nr:hypothetical protein HHK36_018639 [Tetracentron sinense]